MNKTDAIIISILFLVVYFLTWSAVKKEREKERICECGHNKTIHNSSGVCLEEIEDYEYPELCGCRKSAPKKNKKEV